MTGEKHVRHHRQGHGAARAAGGAAPGDVLVEVSFRGTAKGLRIDTLESGTCTCRMKAPGLPGARGLSLTADSEAITCQRSGSGKPTGKPTGKGMAAGRRGAVTCCPTLQTLAQLNATAAVFEWDLDEQGNAKGRTFQWK